MIPEPVRHEAAWTGAGLARRPEWAHVLEERERADLLNLLDRYESSGARRWKDGPAADVPLPNLARRLDRIRTELEEGAGIVRVRGFPSAGLDEAQARVLFGAFSLHLGAPVSQSAAGERIFSVRDAGYPAQDPRLRGPNTRSDLSFHTDRGDITGFLCLQPAKSGGENDVASSVKVYNEMVRRRPDLVPFLMQPFYYLRHTVDEGNDRPWCRQPVFSFAEGHFACCLLRVLIERAHRDPRLPDLTPEQIEALDLVDAIAGDPEMYLRFRQERGDMVFLNNWVVLHRRTAFVDHPEPALRRHILRVWLSPPNSRPLDPLFLENWGAVEAGAVRGGMRPASNDARQPSR